MGHVWFSKCVYHDRKKKKKVTELNKRGNEKRGDSAKFFSLSHVSYTRELGPDYYTGDVYIHTQDQPGAVCTIKGRGTAGVLPLLPTKVVPSSKDDEKSKDCAKDHRVSGEDQATGAPEDLQKNKESYS